MKGKIFKCIPILVATAMIFTIGGIVKAAEEEKNVIEIGDYVIEKVTNPTTSEREVDGITLGGDRNNSYPWAMTERDGYLYVGTNRNIFGGVCAGFANGLMAAGMTYDQIWSVIDVISNGEIPHFDVSKQSPQIIKVDPKTGETKIIYEAPPGTDSAYRMVVEKDNKLYFGSMGNNGTRIVMVDENDNPSVVFNGGGNSSLRAGTVYRDKVYFGGLDNRITDNGEYNKLAVLEKDENNDSNWNRVADYRDFIDYASDNLYSGQGGTVWDLIEFNDELYMFLATSNGFVLFKGHEGKQGETSNEYGWVWKEVIGKNSKYNMGMSDSKEGYNIENFDGLIASAATPVVFKGKMYFGTFDYALLSIMTAATGIMQNIANVENAPNLSETLKPMYDSLRTPQKMYSMDSEGNIQEVSGINEIYSNTSNEYFWRYAVYGDKMYVSSFDSSTLYYYASKLTNGSLCRMSQEELKDQMNYIIECIKSFNPTGEITIPTEETTEVVVGDITEIEKKIQVLLEEVATLDNVEELLVAFKELENYDFSMFKNENLNILQESIKALSEKLDIEGFKMYLDISKKLNHNEYGFDLQVTSDGENYETITTNGFNDKYNYGGRTLVSTKDGLYIGTANPFYGAQIWKLTDKTIKNVEEPVIPIEPEAPIIDLPGPQMVPDVGNTAAANLSKTVTQNKPKTGDENEYLLYTFTLILSGGIIFVIGKNKRILS